MFDIRKKRSAFYGFLIITECLMWGVGNPLITLGLGSLPTFYYIALRFLIAFILFFICFPKRIVKNFKMFLHPAMIAICFFNAAAFISCNYSLCIEGVNVTVCGFLFSLSIVFTPIISPVILKHSFEFKYLPSIIAVVIGLLLICGVGAGNFSFGISEALALLCSLSLSVSLTISAKYLKDNDPVCTSAYMAGFCGALGLILAFVFEDIPSFSVIEPMGWFSLIYLAVGCTFFAYIFQNLALSHVSPTFVSLAFCSEPIFTAAASYFMLNEKLNAQGYIGAAVILVSICYASVLQERGTK